LFLDLCQLVYSYDGEMTGNDVELTMAQFVEARVLNPRVHPQQLSHLNVCHEECQSCEDRSSC